MLKIRKHLDEMKAILEDMDEARENIQQVLTELEKLDDLYTGKKYSYSAYSKLKASILGNKSKGEVLQSYSHYMSNLRRRLTELNQMILKSVMKDTSYEKIKVGKNTQLKHTLLPPMETLEIAQIAISPPKKPPAPKIQKDPSAPSPDQLTEFAPPPPVPLTFWKRIKYAFEAEHKPWLSDSDDVILGGIFSKAFFKYLFTGKDRDGKFIGKTHVLPSILSFESKGTEELGIGKIDVLDPYLLEKQIKELKNLISQRKPEIYKASVLGYIANVAVRKFTISLIERYPEFFKKLYKAIRTANIKILANTYMNIIVFLSIISFLVSLPIFTVYFALQGISTPLGVLLKTAGSAILVTNLTFWIGYYYPFMKAKSRRTSINTNLPFAIDHMSSVIAAGVSPSTMFKLLSHSREYGEISVELEKVTSYVDFFGYDILTSLKAVALNTPSEDFKEFIDGFVSTIETGGDLKDYLSQKSSEALLNYRLERQKYVESLSTYSDIYTGVLIAAPLFFVTSLSLVSVLGGSIGGVDVNVLITIGTYLVIPALNVLFLVFLELNQPEV